MPMTLRIDDRKMRRFVRQMPKVGSKSVARSLNKAITQTRTLAAREVSAKRNILVGRAKKDMRIRRASAARPEAAIHASGRPIPVMTVKGAKTQTKLGVKAKVEAKAKPHLFKGAFIAKMDSGHVGVFTRSKTKKMRGNMKRAAIRELSLPSVAATMVQDQVEKRLRPHAIKVYEKELVRLLNMEMKRAGAR